MKVKVTQLEQAAPVLRRLLDAHFTDVLVAYDMVKIIKAVEQELQSVVEARKKLLETYAERDDKGKMVPSEDAPGTVQLIPEKAQEFWTNVEALGEVNVELSVCQIPLSAVNVLTSSEGKPIMLSPRDLITLDFLFLKPEEALSKTPPGDRN